MYKTVMDLVDDLNRFAAAFGMQVRHFRLTRKTADRSREVLVIFNPNYAGFAGNDVVDYVHVILFEKGENRMLAGDAPLVGYTSFQLDIRPLLVDDFTIGVDADGEIRLMGVCEGGVYSLPGSLSLGNTTHYTPAFLNKGRVLNPGWFGLD